MFSVFCKMKDYYITFTGYAVRLWSKIGKMTVMSQFSDMTSSSSFFNVVSLLPSSLVTGSSFMSISSLVLELWQFSFIRDWPEIQKLEIPPSKFWPISELGMPNLTRLYLVKCYWMLQNIRVTAFTVSELLRENQQRGRVTLPRPRLNNLKNSKTNTILAI